MADLHNIKIVKRIEPEVLVKRVDSSVIVTLDGQTVADIKYVYPWIDNALQYEIAHAIADIWRKEQSLEKK